MLNIKNPIEIETKIDELVAQHGLNEDAKYYILYLVQNELNSTNKNEYGYNLPLEDEKK